MTASDDEENSGSGEPNSEEDGEQTKAKKGGDDEDWIEEEEARFLAAFSSRVVKFFCAAACTHAFCVELERFCFRLKSINTPLQRDTFRTRIAAAREDRSVPEKPSRRLLLQSRASQASRQNQLQVADVPSCATHAVK